MNKITIGRSMLVVLALTTTSAMAFNTFGTTTISNGNNHTPLYGDLNGTMMISIGNNQCPAPITGNIEISKEYLKKYDFNDTVQIFHKMGVNNPSTLNQFTAQMVLPEFMSMRELSGTTATLPAAGLKLFTVNRTANIAVSDAAIVATPGNSNPPHLSFGNGGQVSEGEVLCLATVAPTTVAPGSPASAYAGAGCYDFPIGLSQGTYPTGNQISGVVELDFYTNSGTPILRDHSANEFSYKVEPQFEITCDAKLDGLINWENDSKSFVANKHGQDSTEANVTLGGITNGIDIQSTVLDRLMFTLNNLGGYTDHTHTVCNSKFDAWLEGNQTQFDVIGSTEFDTNWTAASSLISSTDSTLDTNGITLLPGNKIARFTTADQDILNGDTKFALEFDFTDGYTKNALIKAKTFSADINLEGGEVNTSIDVEPYRNTNLDAEKLNVGAWINHAYIAQIAGVGHNPNVLSRIFITNRSCQDVTPTFKVIQNGKVQSVTDIGNYKNPAQSIEISVDSQNVYQLKDIIDAAVAADSTGTIKASGVYSIEIILGGIAEDFYVYAQSKNADNTNTYDLPVYNTSARD